MGTVKQSSWIVGTILLSAVILLGTWFLLAKPVYDTGTETEAQAVVQDEKNDIERKKIALLKKQFEEIDVYRAELAGLRAQIPASLEHAQLQRELADIADEHDVVIASLSISASTEVPLGGGSDAAADPGTDEPGAGGSAAPAAAAAPVPGVTGLYAVPVTLELQGTYADVMAFVAEVQATDQRLLLVLGLTGNAMEKTEEAGGLPARKAGDLSLVVSGQAYVLQDKYGTLEFAAPEDVPTELPKPQSGTNPLTVIK